ncbi:efflux RND transporter periplasmic adaptor subunit [Haloferula helveola]
MKPSLQSLSRNPDPSTGRTRFPAWGIPATIVLGFGLLFLTLFRDRILPAKQVDVAIVLATPAESTAPRDAAAAGLLRSDGPTAFQASGWIEPDPLPIKATALVNGVIDEVHVLEGQNVEQGQPLATLIREDFELALRSAEQMLRTREAERAAQLESIEAGRRSVIAARAQAEAAAAQVEETRDRVDRVEGLSSGSISEAELVSIRSAHRRAKAVEAAASAAVGKAEAEVKQLEANVSVLDAAIGSAKVEVETAQLALSRTKISAPADGRVLRLLGAPGQKKMLAMDDPDSATVAILFDPEHLQVRVDVPLADAAGLQIGQRTRIRCSLLPDTVFPGEVTRITGEADLQRNTLQAKVRIEKPSDQLRPEMLCRVEFLEATARDTSAATGGTGSLTVWIPEAALAGDTVWVCDPESKRVEARTVLSVGQHEDGYLRIDEGLQPGEWVVVGPGDLEDGQRVKPNLIQR